MAISKTLTPTNVTIQIPEFTDQPDQRVNSNCLDKEADAINALNTQLSSLIKHKTFSVGNVSVPSGNYYTAIASADSALNNYFIIGMRVGWASATDVFSIFVASTGDVYVSAKNGTSINSLTIVLLYARSDVVSIAT